MTAPVLSVRDLRVEFPARRGPLIALDDVSFDIHRGEVLGVVGESGAGKSTTVDAIIGLLDPPGRVVRGAIRLSGARIDNLSPDAMRRIRGKRIGVVFQDPLASLDPLYRISAHLVETIVTHTDLTADAARRRALSLLTKVGIAAPELRMDDYPHQFSGGMRQRVVISLALAIDPELLILDEPTAALDVSIQAQIISFLKRLSREHGVAIMLITHDMGVIAEAADRVAVMYAGRIVEIGPVRDVVSTPLHPYTQGLMGSVPRLTDDGRRLMQIPGAMARLTSTPQGCSFYPRCPQRLARCTTERPVRIAQARSEVACWLYDASASERPAR